MRCPCSIFKAFPFKVSGCSSCWSPPGLLVRTRTQGIGINGDGDCKDHLGNLEKNNSGEKFDLERQTIGFKVKQTGRGERNYLKV